MNHEPSDEPTRPATLVSRSKFESLATTIHGAVIECTADAYFLDYNGRTYTTPRKVVAA
ncbi:hypothetical protein GCM10027600_42710 [Nocardioides ginsengisegetis]